MYNKFIYLILFRRFPSFNSAQSQRQPNQTKCEINSCSPVLRIYACACGKSESDTRNSTVFSLAGTQQHQQQQHTNVSSGLTRDALHLFWMKFKFDNILIYSDDGLSLTDVFGGPKLVGATMSRPMPCHRRHNNNASFVKYFWWSCCRSISFRFVFYYLHSDACLLVRLFRWRIFFFSPIDWTLFRWAGLPIRRHNYCNYSTLSLHQTRGVGNSTKNKKRNSNALYPRQAHTARAWKMKINNNNNDKRCNENTVGSKTSALE